MSDMPPAADPLADPAPGSPADLMARWLRHNRLRGCSPATVASCRWPLLRLLEWRARQPPGHGTGTGYQLSRERVQRFLVSTAAHLPSANSRHALAATIRRFLRWLADEGLVDASALKLPPVPRAPAHVLPRHIPPHDLERLLALPDPAEPLQLRDLAMLELLFAAGLRRKALD